MVACKLRADSAPRSWQPAEESTHGRQTYERIMNKQNRDTPFARSSLSRPPSCGRGHRSAGKDRDLAAAQRCRQNRGAPLDAPGAPPADPASRKTVGVEALTQRAARCAALDSALNVHLWWRLRPCMPLSTTTTRTGSAPRWIGRRQSM